MVQCLQKIKIPRIDERPIQYTQDQSLNPFGQTALDGSASSQHRASAPFDPHCTTLETPPFQVSTRNRARRLKLDCCVPTNPIALDWKTLSSTIGYHLSAMTVAPHSISEPIHA